MKTRHTTKETDGKIVEEKKEIIVRCKSCNDKLELIDIEMLLNIYSVNFEKIHLMPDFCFSTVYKGDIRTTFFDISKMHDCDNKKSYFYVNHTEWLLAIDQLRKSGVQIDEPPKSRSLTDEEKYGKEASTSKKPFWKRLFNI